MSKFLVLVGLLMIVSVTVSVRAQEQRTFAGTIVTPQFELVPGVNIEVETLSGKLTVTSDGEGRFSLAVPNGNLTVTFSGKNLKSVTQTFSSSDPVSEVQIRSHTLYRQSPKM